MPELVYLKKLTKKSARAGGALFAPVSLNEKICKSSSNFGRQSVPGHEFIWQIINLFQEFVEIVSMRFDDVMTLRKIGVRT